jgi:tetratricopeptide (TPR) repeat protein/tRNA A-37 threonylcarbamoyl transferase component Bud32
MSAFGPEQWRSLSPYLDKVLEISPNDRATWLEMLRQQNPTVATDLQTLLKEYQALVDEGFLQTDAAARPISVAAPEQTVGAYRLESRIGQGGMGTVWLARRSDGRFEGRAAVKFLNASLMGGASEERFKREGSILARLAHPHIAHLIDAGVSATSQPYLILEYVEGRAIDCYCAELALDIEARIRLFLDVLAAVAHAHANLIVHRDIKPSNVLVTQDARVKLLDFGIAKLLEDEAAIPATVLTREGERALTLAFAAPEQVTGDSITTGTDIYALGVLLHLLLAGKHPAQSALESPLDLMKAIVDTQPPRISDAVPETKLRRALRGDLDTIVAKALKKNPAERYLSVTAFADDLRRYLGHQTISARADTLAYRARKFVRRHRVPVGAVALVIAGLSAGLYVANRQRITAERRFRQVRELSQKVLDFDKAIRQLPGSTEARQRLVSASVEYLEHLSSDARGDLDLAQEVGEGYWRVGRIQGVPTELNLGESAKAELSLKKAEALIETVLRSRPQNRSALLRAGVIAHDRMILAEEEHRRSDALAQAERAAARLDAFLLRADAPEIERKEAVAAYVNLALARVNMHLYEDAIRYARRSVELARPIPSAQSTVGGGLSILANALRYQGDLEGALQAIQEARKIVEGTTYPNEAARMFNLYGIFLREGLILGEDGAANLDRPAEAIEALQKAFDISEAAAIKDPIDSTSRTRVGNSGNPLGNILRHRDPQRALAVFDLAIRRLKEVRNRLVARRDLSMVLANSSYPLRSLHRPDEAKQRIDAALAILKDTKDYPAERTPLYSEVFIALRAQADHEVDVGEPRRALELYEQLLDKVMAAKPDVLNDLREAPRLSRIYEALTGLYRRTGDSEKAESMEARRAELWREWERKLPNNPFVLRQVAAKR